MEELRNERDEILDELGPQAEWTLEDCDDVEGVLDYCERVFIEMYEELSIVFMFRLYVM